MYEMGTLAIVMKVFDMPDNSKSAIVQGLRRVHISKFTQDDPYYKGLVTRVSDILKDDVEMDAISNNLQSIFNNLIEVAPYLSDDQANAISTINNPASIICCVVKFFDLRKV